MHKEELPNEEGLTLSHKSKLEIKVLDSVLYPTPKDYMPRPLF